MNVFFHNSWTSRKAKTLYRGATAPNPNKYFLCLSDSAALSRSSPPEAFFAAELAVGNGYSQRAQIQWAEDGTFSNINKRHDLPLVTASWTADGTLQHQTAFLIADGHQRVSENFSAANVNTGTNVITIAGNLLSEGDKFILQPLPGATLPDPLTADTLYTAINSSSGSFQVSSDGVIPLTITSAGSGNFRLRYATGTIALVIVEDDPILTPSTKPIEYDLYLTEQGGAYGAGV